MGEKFRTFPFKTIRMEFNFVLSNLPKKKGKARRDDPKACKPGGRKFGMEIIIRTFFFQLYESYEIKFPTKMSSFTVTSETLIRFRSVGSHHFNAAAGTVTGLKQKQNGFLSTQLTIIDSMFRVENRFGRIAPGFVSFSARMQCLFLPKSLFFSLPVFPHENMTFYCFCCQILWPKHALYIISAGWRKIFCLLLFCFCIFHLTTF